MYLEALLKFKDTEDVVKIPEKLYDNQKLYIINENDSTLKSISVDIRSSDDQFVYVTNLEDSVLFVSKPVINAKENTKVSPVSNNKMNKLIAYHKISYMGQCSYSGYSHSWCFEFVYHA